MEPIRSLGGVTSSTRVQERAGGGQRQAEAFRRALGGQTEERTADQDGGEPPLRTSLQQKRPSGRNTEGAVARHVDVIA